ncbi:MAG: helix-turn-helix transcriptional regulator [Anaerolineales bacterium]|nr:helix-turn-helix transcriptional regulator [Anaerolineales bacterium]
METLEFPAWLEQKYIEWQSARGKRATLAQFADHLGLSAPLLSHYLNGIRKPTRENTRKLAQRLGPEVYDILGLQHPDPKLRFITRNWSQLTAEQQQQLLAAAEKLLKAGNEESASRTGWPKKTDR